MLFEILFWILLAAFIHLGIFLFVWRTKKRSILGKHVVVTGGSSGIGLWIAIHCARLGAHVTIIARNTQLLEKAVNVIIQNRKDESQNIQYKSIDLSKNYENVTKILDEVEQEIGPIFMLVNCAGMAICGTVDEMPVRDAHLMMDINYFGTYYPTRHILAKMKVARDGIIVITSSQAALLGIYGYGPYAAAKFALRGLAETIAMEANHLGVSVTLALPADTNTPGFENEEKTKPIETKLISGTGGLADPEIVAKQIVHDALTGTFFSIKGLESWLVTILCSGFAPWNGLVWSVLLAPLMAPLKILSGLIQWNFQRIVRQCHAENSDNKKKQN